MDRTHNLVVTGIVNVLSGIAFFAALALYVLTGLKIAKILWP